MVNLEVFNTTSNDYKKEMDIITSAVNKTLSYEKVDDCLLNVIIVDNNYIREINKQYRNIDKVTDVISFALEDEKENNFDDIRVLGDIYLSIDRAKEQLKEYHMTIEEEITFLTIHGVLHLLGYDHMIEEDEQIMFTKQELILDELFKN